ncbi:MAG: hypothetical protein HY511_01350 [Actinobacteria bacterium]|nr:hypothetical protein [Actinomycetota bacterium]
MIGYLLVLSGALTQARLDEALREQQRRADAGQRVRLGDLLVELGWITADQVQAVTAQLSAP